jgi:DNA-directed RNA polymerase II subunit RPB2
MNLESDTWNIIDSYFRDIPNYIVRHHVDSYNDFVDNKIPLVFKNLNHQEVIRYDKDDSSIRYTIDIYYGGVEANKYRFSKPTIMDHVSKTMKQMYPNEARLKNLTYGFDVFYDVDIFFTIQKGETKVLDRQPIYGDEFCKNMYLGKIPIILHSNMCILNKLNNETLGQVGECRYDPGGYLIIDGREKVIMSQERKAENTIFLSKLNNPNLKFTHIAEIKSVSAEAFTTARTNKLQLETKGTITVRLGQKNPFLQEVYGRDVPLFVMFRVLGIETDKEIMEYIIGDLETPLGKKMMSLLQPSVIDPYIIEQELYDKTSAEAYLEKLPSRAITESKEKFSEISSNKVGRLSFLYHALRENLLPHCGDDFKSKTIYLGYMTRKLLLLKLDLEEETNKDNFINKRIDISGFMLSTLFRDALLQVQYTARVEIGRIHEFNSKEYSGDKFPYIINDSNYYNVFSSSKFQEVFMGSLKKGSIGTKQGVVQSMERVNYIGTLSHLRRITDPGSGSEVTLNRRRLHVTQYGSICPAETPEGQNVGLRKALSVIAHITFGMAIEPIIDFLQKYGIIETVDVLPLDLVNKTKVLINGNIVGVHNNPNLLLEMFRLYRRNGLINIFNSITWDIINKEIVILTDNGRLIKPLYIIEDNDFLIQPKHIEDINDNKLTFTHLLTGFSKRKNDYDYFLNKSIKLEDIGINETSDSVVESLRKTQGVIEYLDTKEFDSILVSEKLNLAVDNKLNYTHAELHASMMLGLCASLVPFVQNEQGPRFIFASKQVKQGAGTYASNYRHRIDTSNHLLHYPNKPLVLGRLHKAFNNDKMVTGQNIVVAIAQYNGYNCDDAIIGNKSSLDMGLFNSSYFKMYQETEKIDTKQGISETFYNPLYETGAQQENELGDDKDNELADSKKMSHFEEYKHLDKNGFIKEGTYLEGGEVMIGKKIKYINGAGEEETRDMSKTVKKDNVRSVVDKVYACQTNANGDRMVKVRTVQYRKPEIGDKFASRCAQKGTFGMLLDRQDMPYTEDGLIPDILLSPYAYPKRMTVSQFIELLFGNLAVDLGIFGLGSPLEPMNPSQISDVLLKLGLSDSGDRVLYNGYTGEQLNVKIFTGVMYYQRLKYMVGDKINTRIAGNRDENNIPVPGGAYTFKERQVVPGRANGGGLRIGEMERDAIISHGAMGFLKESMIERCDKYEVYISRKTGEISIANPYEKIYYDPSSDGPLSYQLEQGSQRGDFNILGINTINQEQLEFSKIIVPYTFKLLIQELQGLCQRVYIKVAKLGLLFDNNGEQAMDIDESFIQTDSLTDDDLDEMNIEHSELVGDELFMEDDEDVHNPEEILDESQVQEGGYDEDDTPDDVVFVNPLGVDAGDEDDEETETETETENEDDEAEFEVPEGIKTNDTDKMIVSGEQQNSGGINMTNEPIETGALFDSPKTRPNLNPDIVSSNNNIFSGMSVNEQSNSDSNNEIKTPMIEPLPEIKLTPTNQHSSNFQQTKNAINKEVNRLVPPSMQTQPTQQGSPDVKTVTIDLNVNTTPTSPETMTDLLSAKKSKKTKNISFGEVETNPSLNNISSEGDVITGSIPSPF